MDDATIGKEEMAGIIRDNIHNLDLKDSESSKIFKEYTRKFFIKLEGCYLEAYDDAVGAKDGKNLVRNILSSGKKVKGKVTIGIGFNMDAAGANKEWQKAKIFKSFKEVKTGKAKLTKEEVNILFDHSLDIRIQELQNREYKGLWDKLRPNEKLGILSPYFNGPGTVNIGTKFHQHITAYVATADPKYLCEAFKELRFNTNKEGDKKERREAESTLLDSAQCPFYVSGTDENFSYIKTPVSIEKTIIPRGMPSTDSEKYKDFFVWRTQLDSKVRFEHWKREGLIYKKDDIADNKMPGCEYGCRCRAEAVPDIVFQTESKFFTKRSSYLAFRILCLRIRMVELNIKHSSFSNLFYKR